jgi:hypothetical protein
MFLCRNLRYLPWSVMVKRQCLMSNKKIKKNCLLIWKEVAVLPKRISWSQKVIRKFIIEKMPMHISSNHVFVHKFTLITLDCHDQKPMSNKKKLPSHWERETLFSIQRSLLVIKSHS